MKVLLEKDYEFVGIEDNWYVFKSRPKENFDPEIIKVQRARMILLTGESRYFDRVY